jgi:hypothetical protein
MCEKSVLFLVRVKYCFLFGTKKTSLNGSLSVIEINLFSCFFGFHN